MLKFLKLSNLSSSTKVTVDQAKSGHVASAVYSLRPIARAYGVELEVEF